MSIYHFERFYFLILSLIFWGAVVLEVGGAVAVTGTGAGVDADISSKIELS